MEEEKPDGFRIKAVATKAEKGTFMAQQSFPFPYWPLSKQNARLEGSPRTVSAWLSVDRLSLRGERKPISLEILERAVLGPREGGCLGTMLHLDVFRKWGVLSRLQGNCRSRWAARKLISENELVQLLSPTVRLEKKCFCSEWNPNSSSLT